VCELGVMAMVRPECLGSQKTAGATLDGIIENC